MLTGIHDTLTLMQHMYRSSTVSAQVHQSATYSVDTHTLEPLFAC